MGNLLAGLVRNFLLLRDLFGYAIPGAVVLAAANRALYFDVKKLPLASDSIWLKAAVFLTASYVIGHVLAAIFFLPWDLRSAQRALADRRAAKNAEKKADKAEKAARPYETKAERDERKAQKAARKAREAEEKETDAAYYRYLYPFMFNEADRRETLTVLRLCLAVSLLVVAGILVFSEKRFPWSLVSLGFGIFMLFNASISRLVARRSVEIAIEASKRAKAADIASFTWR